MDGEPVEEPPSDPVRCGAVFDRLCGPYMAMGMSYSDFWDGDCAMVRYYREADEHRRDRENFNAWLHGLYIYRAVIDAAPVLNPMNKRHTPHKYLKEPLPLTRGARKRAQEEEERRKLENGRRYMEAMMAGVNAKFKRKAGERDGC